MPLLDTLLTAVSTAGAAVTLTIPAPPTGQRQRIYKLEITMYTTAARAGTATPVTVTTTNLNSLAFTLPSAGAIGTVFVVNWEPSQPINVQGQAMSATVVCPATTSVIWRVNALYRLEEA